MAKSKDPIVRALKQACKEIKKGPRKSKTHPLIAERGLVITSYAAPTVHVDRRMRPI